MFIQFPNIALSCWFGLWKNRFLFRTPIDMECKLACCKVYTTLLILYLVLTPSEVNGWIVNNLEVARIATLWIYVSDLLVLFSVIPRWIKRIERQKNTDARHDATKNALWNANVQEKKHKTGKSCEKRHREKFCGRQMEVERAWEGRGMRGGSTEIICSRYVPACGSPVRRNISAW